MTSMLTRMHCCHPCPSALVIARKANWVFLFDRNQFGHQLIQHFTTGTTRKGGVNWRSRNYDRNIHWTFRSTLLQDTWLGISLEIQRVIRRLIGVLELRLGLVNLEGMTSVFLQLERSEPTTWEVTSAQVQKHNLSTMLSRQANSDSFSSSSALALSSDRSIHSFNASISACCQLRQRKNLSCSLSTYASLTRLLSAMASAYTLTSAKSFFIWACSRSRRSP